MPTDLVKLKKINKAKRNIEIKSYHAASGTLNSNQIRQLTRQEMKGALFLIRMRTLEQMSDPDKTIIKYHIGG